MSGMYIAPELVKEACDMTLKIYIEQFKKQKETILKETIEKGRFSFLHFKRIPLTYAEARQYDFRINMFEGFIENPMINRTYSKIKELRQLALQAIRYDKGASIYVSASDHYLISWALARLIEDEKVK